MAASFRGWQIERVDGGTRPRLRSDLTLDDLGEGDVVIDVAHSSLNYKDGLAFTGAAPIVRRFPLVPGIDLAGTVRESSAARFKPGDVVVVTGFGLGERVDGGLAERARLPSTSLMKLPAGFTTAQAMAIGTAGVTAIVALQQLELAGVQRGTEVVVTGAGGGVGSMAIMLLAAAGFRPVAVTGRAELTDELRALGAFEVLPRSTLAEPIAGPLGKSRFAAAIDSVGGAPLANLLKSMRYEGVVIACGLAAGPELETSVYPFILRAVRLIGVDSVDLPMFKRDAAWGRMDVLLDRAKLDAMRRVIPLADAERVAAGFTAGKVQGRIVVDVRA